MIKPKQKWAWLHLKIMFIKRVEQDMRRETKLTDYKFKD